MGKTAIRRTHPGPGRSSKCLFDGGERSCAIRAWPASRTSVIQRRPLRERAVVWSRMSAIEAAEQRRPQGQTSPQVGSQIWRLVKFVTGYTSIVDMTRPAPERSVTYAHTDVNRDARLRELIIYISQRSMFDPRFGVTKLNKLLWWTDTTAFGRRGRPVSGATYIRLPQGPVPDGIDELREQMRVDGDIAVSEVMHYGHRQHRPVALRSATLSAFTGEEIAIVDEIINAHQGRNARAVSNRSHGRMWEALPMGSRMPYESVFVSDRKATRYDMARTRELSRRFGWE